MRRTISGLLAISFLGVATVGYAQEAAPAQTPENAQLFLTQIAARGGLQIAFLMNGEGSHAGQSVGWNRKVDSVWNVDHSYGDYSLTKYSSEAKCASTFRYTVPPIWNDGRGGDFEAPLWAYADSAGGNYSGVPLDWSTVAEVNGAGNSVEIAVSHPYEFRRIRVIFPAA
ncbi:MAG: hypothetical protein EOP50_22475 [Sphingobacteriales bacterium]|nr:MAG: hypothetical protein EOP50_22475 [Sphingobacteriales bacterium]